MVAKRISESELATSLPEFLERARKGKRFAIERDGEIIAAVIPLASKPGITARELIARVGNLGIPGEGFGDDLEAIQADRASRFVIEEHYDDGSRDVDSGGLGDKSAGCAGACALW